MSIGGNDLKQFFYAADRENERVRRRYDTLSVPYLALLKRIIDCCAEVDVPVSFCGEDAGRPVEAATFAALGLRRLSMRPASIGPIKHLIRRIDLVQLAQVVDQGIAEGVDCVRPAVTDWLARSA